MSDPEFTCVVRLSWIPFPEQGAGRGRMMVHRTVAAYGSADGDSDDGVAEFWLSPYVDEVQFFDADPVPPSSQWKHLALGQRVDTLAAPVALRPAGHDELREILERLARGRDQQWIRTLLGLDARLCRVNGALTVRSARLRRVDADVLVHPFRSIFDDSLTTLHRAGPVVTRPGGDRSLHDDRSLRADLAACVELDDVRGAVIGSRNLQIDQYVIDVRPREISFEELLGAPDVVALIDRANRDPGDDAHRRALVDRLARSYRLFGPAPATLEVTGPGRERVGGFLRGLLSFRVQGVQVGDHNTQRNEFTYVVPTVPSATELLRGNRPLAEALAGCLCPAPGDTPNVTELDARYRAVLRGLDVEYRDGRDRAVQHALPERGTVLRLARIDGLTIGTGNEQRVSETIKITEIGYRELHQRWQRGEIERARIEAARVEAARVEAARVEAARVEAARIEAARVEAARVEAARVEAQRVARQQPTHAPRIGLF